MNVGRLLLGVVLVIGAVVSIWWPEAMWKLSLFGRRWQHDEDEDPGLNAATQVVYRIMGGLTGVVGVALIITGLI